MSTNGKTPHNNHSHHENHEHPEEGRSSREAAAAGDDASWAEDDDGPRVIHVHWTRAFNPFSSKCVYVNQVRQVYDDRVSDRLPTCTEVGDRLID